MRGTRPGKQQPWSCLRGVDLQVMMCSASSRPTIASASRLVMQQGAGIRPFFAGVAPRALSNGLNSAVFFCFFEALRGVSPGLRAAQPA